MKRLVLFCVLALFAGVPVVRAATMDAVIAPLEHQWAVINFQMTDIDQQKKAIAVLVDQATQAVHDNPGKAEPMIWQAIIISTRAGIEGGFGALSEVEQARDILLEAEKINPQALSGSVYASLGSLYYKVPSWPIGFGDNKLARQYLEKGIAIAPDDIDTNFFYGEFLYETSDYAKAKTMLEHALNAPLRPGRDIADKGRREEIQEVLKKVNAKLS